MIKHVIRILVVFAFLIPVFKPAHALSPSQFTLSDLGEKDIVVRAIYDQITLQFPLAEGRQITQATLQLHLSHGKKLLPELSELSIALNNEPVANLPLTSENAEAGVFPISIPVNAFQPGENTLIFRFNLRLKDKGCTDVGDPALWAKIFSDTAIEIESVDIPIQPNIGRYPAPFSSVSTLPGNAQLTIVLPTQPNSAELTAAVQITSALGQATHWDTPPIQAITTAAQLASMDENDHLIAISTGNRNPLAESAPIGLSEFPSPTNPNRLLLIVKGSDETELRQLSEMLSTQSARTYLVGTLVAPMTIQPIVSGERETEETFAGLGYNTRRVRGIGQHDLYYAIDIPYDWKTTSDATIEVEFTHAPGLTSDTASLMSAFVNGFKVSDVPLTGRNETNGRLTIHLSPRQLHPGRNWLHLSFDLHLHREDCAFRYLEQAWVEISADTSLVNLAHVRGEPPLDLHYLPSPLVTPTDLSDDLFVLANNPSSTELTAMVRLAAKLGTYTTADGLRPQAVTADAFHPDMAQHIIAIGQPASHDLLAAYNAQFPQPLILTGGLLIPSGGREPLLEEVSGQAGYIEILPAPWNRSQTLLVLSAPDELYPALIGRLPVLGKRIGAEGNLGIVTAKKLKGIEVGVLADSTLSPQSRGILGLLFFGAVITMGGIGFAFTRRKRTSQEINDEEE